MVDSISLSRSASLPQLQLSPSFGISGQAAQVEGEFGSILESMAKTADVVRQGEASAIAGIEGRLPLQTVVENVMAAERTLQATLAVRDKLVSAYLEISRMQI